MWNPTCDTEFPLGRLAETVPDFIEYLYEYLRRCDRRFARRDQPVEAGQGFSKDRRGDLEQLVWILTISADGAVTITHC